MFLSGVRCALRRACSIPSSRLCIAEEVRSALDEGRGVVALESTVITHGLPRPQNVKLAQSLQSIVRSHGAVPATIALFDGKVHIGLNDEQLKRIGDDVDSIKVSKRDIPYALVNKLVGGTTVAATVYLADVVGIRVFATGGLGGVHRGVNETFDISADLLELASAPVAVVCAGVKSILDVQKTLEYLETNSVPVVVYGDTLNFPGFFTAETSWKAHVSTQSLEEIADLMECSRAMGLPNGTVVACPIPSEHEAEGKLVNEAIEAAVMECREVGVSSKNVTPFLLKRVNELTAGASVKTNIALLENNAHIASKLANILAQRNRSSNGSEARTSISSSSMKKPTESEKKTPTVVVIGASILDFEAITNLDVRNDGGSYPGKIAQRCGGVGRNHADALTRLGVDVQLISALGNDSHAEFIRSQCEHMLESVYHECITTIGADKLNTSVRVSVDIEAVECFHAHIKFHTLPSMNGMKKTNEDLTNVMTIDGIQTATYTAFTVKGNVQYGISTIEQIIERITPETIKKREDLISDADFVLIDGNILIETINAAVSIADFYGTKVWYEPTDIAKMRKIFDAGVVDKVDVTSPNINEFVVYCKLINEQLPDEFLTKWEANKMFDHLWDHADRYLRSLEALVVTVGPKGSMLLKRDGGNITRHQLAAPLQPEAVVSASGAGDCFNSGLLAGMLFGIDMDKSLQLAQKCAALSLQSAEAVPSSISDLRPHLSN